MGKTFENWLIASDIDGTLNSKWRQLPRRNLEAIQRFVDAGGHFTLASGRLVSSMERNYRKVACNAPGVVINGAGIYDFNEKKMLWRSTIGEAGQNFVRHLMERFSAMDVGVFFDDYVYTVKKGLLSQGQVFFDKAGNEICPIDQVPKEGWCKVIFWSNPFVIRKLKAYAVPLEKEHQVHFMESSIWSLEMLAENTHKGIGVLKLAEMLGVEHSHVAAIGDYYNDWDMLKSVGLPACPKQAPQPIHEICKFEAGHCNQGCVADLIEHIMDGT
ncbi:MAG: HAD-IIB family hydrolase [Clostridiales bacterium]|nr:HAD-IIB family hydrolase [Clostridiales bacterium]